VFWINPRGVLAPKFSYFAIIIYYLVFIMQNQRVTFFKEAQNLPDVYIQGNFTQWNKEKLEAPKHIEYSIHVPNQTDPLEVRND
jgi:hypothetical protein